MEGQEIIYRCRAPWLVRVTLLELNDDGFRAEGTPSQEVPDDLLDWRPLGESI